MRPVTNTTPATAAPPELWGGVECTVNRVGDCYFDQIERTGHATRAGDLDRFAALGIRTLRYPILWERTAPDVAGRADWTWADERMERMRALGIRPIVGLVHHGSGPLHTSLIDPAFADGLAEYARAVAQRYPWALDYTPVNEPLTTARFSALYGHWYPHRCDSASFVRALLVQCRATVMAMRAIRAVTPGARLVQTEDIGTTFSTPTLAYQAEHENGRRLLSLDLLCGRVDRNHPFWPWLLTWGATEAELEFFRDAPAPPDVIGINYYVTSDRLLDQRLAHYPAWSHGGNGRHTYADVEAARGHQGGITGQLVHLRALWERYRRPLAITEVHMGATREQQMRWLDEAWQAALRARDEGIDVRAVTIWALLGSLDWNQLVVRADGFYETGAFDIRGAAPRPTAITAMAHALAAGRPYHHPVLSSPGWWRLPERLQYGPRPTRIEQVSRPAQTAEVGHGTEPAAVPLLIAGGSGALGQAFARICALRGLPHRVLARSDMDIADAASVHGALERMRPWAVVNAAGYARVNTAEHERDRCRRENTSGALVLAEVCRERRVRLLTFSSDFVFDGAQDTPYVESDRVGPLSVYGASKAAAERGVLAMLESALVVRTSAFFGPWDERSFLARALRNMLDGHRVRAAADAMLSPTYLPDLVHTALDLLIDGERGVWHLANRGAVSWAELVRLGADVAGVRHHLLDACATAALGLAAPRPVYSVLGSERGALLPSLEEALQRFASEHAMVCGRT
jgi:dTDP-4-dehydrorhamnose reductase